MSKITTPPYSDFPFISNERVSLRQILNTDINDLIEISFYDAIQATSLEQAMVMNSKINTDYQNGESIHWAIVDNQSNNIVGTCGYYRGFEKNEGELGCVLLAKYRGQGIMTSAMLLAIDFGLKVIGLNRIWAITDQQNDKAIQLLERLGFIKINVLDDKEVEFEFVPKTKIIAIKKD